MVGDVHCCHLMQSFIEKSDWVGYRTDAEVYYSSILREYYMCDQVRQNIFYCPWCGSALPISLRGEYKTILYEQYGISDRVLYNNVDSDNIKDISIKTDEQLQAIPNLPEEFKSDEWWKKRGL